MVETMIGAVSIRCNGTFILNHTRVGMKETIEKISTSGVICSNKQLLFVLMTLETITNGVRKMSEKKRNFINSRHKSKMR